MLDRIPQSLLEVRLIQDFLEFLHVLGVFDSCDFPTRVVPHLLGEVIEEEVAVVGEPLVVESEHTLHRGFADRLAATEDLPIGPQRQQVQEVATGSTCTNNEPGIHIWRVPEK